MHIYRTRFNKDIVAEFLPPLRKVKTAKVIIFCDGMPTLPAKRRLLYFFAKKGFWVFHPRYRGSWESDGSFLKTSPHLDILDVLNQLPKGFNDLLHGKKYKIKSAEIFIVGGSFGGPAALLVSKDPRIKKVMAISPVVDWQAPSKKEPLDYMYRYVQKAYGSAYRMGKSNWDKLKRGNFYNPVAHLSKIEGSKCLLIHAKDDKVVSALSVNHFTELSGSKLIMLRSGGHLSSSVIMEKRFWGRVKKFINKK